VTRSDRRDRLAALALAAAMVVEALTSSHRHGPVSLDVLATLAMALPLALRRRFPVGVLVVAMAAAVLSEAALTPVSGRVLPIVAVVAYSWSAGRFAPTGRALAGLAAALAGLTAIAVIEGASVDNILFPIVFFGWLPWIAGRMLRHRTALARELAERTARLERDRAEAAWHGIQEERRRLARELHDVVAHSLSVMIIQAGAGRRLAERDPGAAAACAELIERMGRESLAELRRLLGVMRDQREPAAALAPQPSFAHVDELLHEAREAGLSLDVRTTGVPVTLPAGVDLAAYRIVQEALINILKHVGPSRAHLIVRYLPDTLELEVRDDGPGPSAPAPADGHGLIGMRERTALCGGELYAGRGPAGGWLVHARLPLARELAAA
jgi:signal transduction histidine kinase